MSHNITFSKTACEYIMYLYALREATRWQGNIFKDENSEIASKVYDCIATGNYEPEQSEDEVGILPCEVKILRFTNPEFIEAHPNDMKITPFLIDGLIANSPVEVFIGWPKNIKMTHAQSQLVQSLKDNHITRNAYNTMLDVIIATKPTDSPEFKTHQPPKGLLFTAMLINEYNIERSSSVVCEHGLRVMIDDIISIAAKGRSDMSQYVDDDINVAGCIRWFLFNGVDITKLGIVDTVPYSAYDSPTAGYLAYLLGYDQILDRVIKATAAFDTSIWPETDPVMFLEWRESSVETTRTMALMALMKLKQRMATPDYVKYLLCPKLKKLVRC